MKKLYLILLFLFVQFCAVAQQKDKAEALVKEGVAYHDKGDFNGAINRYDQALSLDKDNLDALAEKAYSLLLLQQYDEAILCCKKAIETHPADDGLNMVYVIYGTACDNLKRTDESISVYDSGLKIFPDSYLLLFNKGVTLASVKRYDEAMPCFQKAIMLNPKHAGSHNAIARISDVNGKKIPALLAYWRFLVLEPAGERAKQNFENMKRLMYGNIEETDKNAININMDSSALDTTNSENNFSAAEMVLSLSAALNYDKKYAKESEIEKFIRNFTSVCESLQENKQNGGFFWDYYAPYFAEMKNQNLIVPFACVIFSSSDDARTVKWIKSHQQDIDKFYEWSDNFKWNKNYLFLIH